MARYNPISVAVIDLFASSLGAFMLLYFLGIPFNKIGDEPTVAKSMSEFMSEIEIQDATGITGYYQLKAACNGDLFDWRMSFSGRSSGIIKYQTQSSLGELVLVQSFSGYLLVDNRIADIRTAVIKQVGDWGGPALSLASTYVYNDRVELHNHSCMEVSGPIVIPKISNEPVVLSGE